MASQWFWTAVDGEKHGPFTARQFKDMAESGQILPTDWVKKEGMTKSVKASRIKGLFAPIAGDGGPARS